MSFFDFLTGKPGKIEQAQIFTDEQIEALKRILAGGGRPEGELYGAGEEYIKRLLSGEGFEEFEAPLIRQFEEQTVPGVAERFAGIGGLSSSGLQQALGQAASGLTEKLGAQRAGLTQQALGQGLQYAQQPMQNLLAALGLKPQQPYYQPGTTGFASQMLDKWGGGF